MEFDAKVQGTIDFETLQARRDPGLPPVPVQEGSILHLNDLENSEWESSLNSMKRRMYDREYSSDDICFPLLKGFHKEDNLNCRTDSPCERHLGIYAASPQIKYSKDLTWWTKDTWMECNK
jgi:hypothetical protein